MIDPPVNSAKVDFTCIICNSKLTRLILVTHQIRFGDSLDSFLNLVTHQIRFVNLVTHICCLLKSTLSGTQPPSPPQIDSRWTPIGCNVDHNCTKQRQCHQHRPFWITRSVLQFGNLWDLCYVTWIQVASIPAWLCACKQKKGSIVSTCGIIGWQALAWSQN